jgi:hypothetical protein
MSVPGPFAHFTSPAPLQLVHRVYYGLKGARADWSSRIARSELSCIIRLYLDLWNGCRDGLIKIEDVTGAGILDGVVGYGSVASSESVG